MSESSTATATATAAEAADPRIWLEEVTGSDALYWVRARNAETSDRLASGDGFDTLRKRLLAIYDSDERIAYLQKHGEHYYNFWRDAAHPRGLWRRTTLDSYRSGSPAWDVLLDLDALAEAEDEGWVWAGVDHLPPAHERALISLSRGGADATVVREFDLTTRSFVEGGFQVPEAKTRVAWIDRDTVFVGTDFGDGSLTASGYPRLVKRWKRGTPLAEAELVLEGDHADISAGGWHDHTPGFARSFVYRGLTFYTSEIHELTDAGLVKVDKPYSASVSVHRDWLVFELREAWELDGTTHPAGSLLVTSYRRWMAGDREVDVLFAPSETTSLAGFSFTANHLILNVLDNVRNRLEVLTPGPDGWSRRPLPGVPELGQVSASAVDPDTSDAYWLHTTDFVTPSSLLLGEIDGGEPELLARLPAFFDASGLEVTQHFATSADGTRVPYFQVARADLPLDHSAPTLLYGYGGFEISLLPQYSAGVGTAWLERGGVYVIANIRGGGEFGPRWHQAALRDQRHRAYEDFAAVADDLVARGVASPRRLGVQGGSNGGLLVGNMYTLYPDRFGAVVCQVPLLDMQRYTKLLAGASWAGEYGDPDVPEDWAFIRTFSPYHNIRDGVDYPPILFMTSTRDDRVHPGHARKMAHALLERGEDVTYYENIEGGHGGSANNEQAAYMAALAYTFLWERLADDGG